jgi:membrane-bound lytic murein transglycosylase B
LESVHYRPMPRTTRLIAGLVALLGLLLGAARVPAVAQRIDPVAFEAAFQDWLQREIWPEARRNGVSRRTFDEAFAGVTLDLTLPELVLPGAGDEPAIDQPEPEPGSLLQQSISRRWPGLAANASASGRRPLRRSAALRARSVVRDLGPETAYGGWPFHTTRSCPATAAHRRRAAEFRLELIAALQILDRGDITRAQWWSGGRIGHTAPTHGLPRIRRRL